MNMEIRDVGPDLTKLTEGDTPATAAHAHLAVCLYDLTIAELAAEWRRLNKWDETDEYTDHGDCRLDRMSQIERILRRKRAKSADELIQKWAVLELLECTDNEHHKSIVDAFRWGEDDWSAAASFEHSRTSDLLRSIFQDMSRLSQAA
jgi:hypothetical protein